MSDVEGCSLIVTTGGTGPALRDVTPEATEAVCSKMMPGFGELMRSASLKFVPTAILSRQTAGIRGNSLIVNLPGKPSAIDDCLNAVFPAIPYCIDLIGGRPPGIRSGAMQGVPARARKTRIARGWAARRDDSGPVSEINAVDSPPPNMPDLRRL